MTPSLLSTASRYFLEVARTGSVTRAADELHVAASAISRQIGKLEANLGCALFERRARGMSLSEAGERLVAHLRSIVLDGERVIAEVRGLAGQRSRHIHVACTQGLASGFMAGVMSLFRRLQPDCSIHLRVCAPDEVSRHLLRGDVDVGVKFSVAPEKGLQIEHSQAQPILALVAPGHPLARRRRVSAADIVRYPMALPESGSTVRQMLDLCCSLNGLQYREVYTGDYKTLLDLATHGGVLMLSAEVSAAHAIRAGDLVAVRVDEPQFRQRTLQVLTLRGHALNATSSRFMEHLIAAALGQSPQRRRR